MSLSLLSVHAESYSIFTTQMKGDKQVAVLVVRDDCPITSKKDKASLERFSIYRPSTGLQVKSFLK
jgi:hypothetical protein